MCRVKTDHLFSLLEADGVAKKSLHSTCKTSVYIKTKYKKDLCFKTHRDGGRNSPDPANSDPGLPLMWFASLY